MCETEKLVKQRCRPFDLISAGIRIQVQMQEASRKQACSDYLRVRLQDSFLQSW